VTCVGFQDQQTVSPDGDFYFEIGSRGNPFIWNLAEGREEPVEWIDSYVRYQVAFSTNNLMAADTGGGASVYDLETQTEKYAIEFEEPVEDLALSANGDVLVLAGWELAFTWDLKAPEPARVELAPCRLEIPFMEEVAVSADGSLVAGDCTDTLMLWDAHTGQLLHSIEFTDEWLILDTIRNLVFSPDGRYLAISMADGTILLWGVR
jgi:WD40 repeat protein